MSVRVPDWGSRRSKLVLIGEAPGTYEIARGKPFVGPSGGRLEVWWRQFGLCRDDFYITNVVPYLPENINKIPEEEVREHIRALKDRLLKLEEPWLIVPTGNYALYGTTGKGKVSFHHKDGRHERPGISDWRGSILTTELGDRLVKTIPTLHPAHVLRQPGYERECLHDWRRISQDVLFPELRLPEREHYIKPTIEDVELFVADAMKAPYLSVDIETPKSWITEVAVVVVQEEVIGRTGKTRNADIIEWQRGIKRGDPRVARYKSGDRKGTAKFRSALGPSYIGCIGLSIDPKFSLTVPTTLAYWRSKDKLERVKKALEQLLTSPLGPQIVMQNGMFDSAWLAWSFGWDLSKRWVWDTRAMHHALDPRDQHSLDYMASILTRQPFWKHEAKDPDEIMKYASNSEALWTYNGIDVCTTLEIFLILKAQLHAEGLMEFYLAHYARMIPPLLDMTLHGVNIDNELRANERIRLDGVCDELGKKVEAAAGESLLGEKALSNTKLAHYFYNTLKIPPQFKRGKFGERTVTTDEVTVRRLIRRYPNKLGVTGPMILDLRKYSKQREFLDDSVLDTDFRARCQYSFITEAGRLASHSTPWGTGRNLQNIDRELRYVFVPDAT